MEDGLIWDSTAHKYVYDDIMGNDPCTYCGMDLCECDRLAAEQNDDYESLVY